MVVGIVAALVTAAAALRRRRSGGTRSIDTECVRSGPDLCDAIPAEEPGVVMVREGGARICLESRDGQSAECEASAVVVTVLAVREQLSPLPGQPRHAAECRSRVSEERRVAAS